MNKWINEYPYENSEQLECQGQCANIKPAYTFFIKNIVFSLNDTLIIKTI